jgi:hypothetical protein
VLNTTPDSHFTRQFLLENRWVKQFTQRSLALPRAYCPPYWHFYTKGIGCYSTVPPTRVPPLCEYPARKIYPKNWYDYDPAVYSRTDRWIPVHGPLDLRIPDHQTPKHKNRWISQKQTAGSPRTDHWIPKLLTTTGPEKRRTVGSQNTDHWLPRKKDHRISGNGPLDPEIQTSGSQETDRWIHKTCWVNFQNGIKK